jgi:hypothetical protein
VYDSKPRAWPQVLLAHDSRVHCPLAASLLGGDPLDRMGVSDGSHFLCCGTHTHLGCMVAAYRLCLNQYIVDGVIVATVR